MNSKKEKKNDEIKVISTSVFLINVKPSENYSLRYYKTSRSRRVNIVIIHTSNISVGHIYYNTALVELTKALKKKPK